jgi:peptidoglycan hydrolase-like protein with peptidoglycan-binding domain
VQEALHRLGYYDGPVDGIFGPLTRTAIRRFQESIGEKIRGV